MTQVMSLLAVATSISLAAVIVFAPNQLLAGGVLTFALTCALALLRPRVSTERVRVHSRTTLFAGFSLIFVTFSGIRVAENATLADALLVMVATVLILERLSHASIRQRTMPPGWLWAAGAVLLTSGVIAAVASGQVTENAIPALRLTGALVGIPWIVAASLRNPNDARFLATTFCLSAVINSAVGVVDYTGLTSWGPRLTGVVALGRSAGLTVHPNHLAMVASLAIPISLSLAGLRGTRWVRRLHWYAATAILALGVLSSGSRAGVVTAAVGVVGFAVLTTRDRVKTVAGICIAAACVLGVAFTIGRDSDFGLAIQRLTGASTEVSNVVRSDRGRSLLLDRAMESISERPFTGVGFSAIRDAHNVFVQLLQAGGPLALVGFLIFAAGVSLLGVRMWRRSDISESYRLLSVGLFLATFVWMVGALGQNILQDRYLYVPAGILLGFASVTGHGRNALLLGASGRVTAGRHRLGRFPPRDSSSI